MCKLKSLLMVSIVLVGCVSGSPTYPPDFVSPAPSASRFLEMPQEVVTGREFVVRIKADRNKEPIRLLNEDGKCLGRVYWIETCACKEIRVTLQKAGERTLHLEVSGKVVESRSLVVAESI